MTIENWDQDKLKDIFYAIKKHGNNPEEYIDLHYSVSEEKFNNWPEHIKNIFKPARINKYASNCCGTSIIENTDLCSHCKEHCESELVLNNNEK